MTKVRVSKSELERRINQECDRIFVGGEGLIITQGPAFIELEGEVVEEERCTCLKTCDRHWKTGVYVPDDKPTDKLPKIEEFVFMGEPTDKADVQDFGIYFANKKINELIQRENKRNGYHD